MYNIGHTAHHAADGASAYLRCSVGSLVVCCTLLGGMGVTGAAHAGPGDERAAPRREEMHAQREAIRAERAAERQQQGQAGQQQGPRPAEARQLDPRSFEARAEEQRRAMQDANRNAEAGRRIRLTADERRDLRRQINEAGQDIYATPPRR